MCKHLFPGLVKNHLSPVLGRRTQKGRRSWSNLFSLGSGGNQEHSHSPLYRSLLKIPLVLNTVPGKEQAEHGTR